jgi:hypothetical protein
VKKVGPASFRDARISFYEIRMVGVSLHRRFSVQGCVATATVSVNGVVA